MLRIRNWLIAMGVIVGVGLLTPITAWGQVCETCDNLTGLCEPVDDPDDRCYQGGDGDDVPYYCASWGSIMDCDDDVFIIMGADGAPSNATGIGTAAPRVRTRTAREMPSSFVRDCRDRIVSRSYTSAEAAKMRRMSESITI